MSPRPTRLQSFLFRNTVLRALNFRIWLQILAKDTRGKRA